MVSAVALLLAGAGSGWSATTLAVLVRVPALSGWTTIVIVALAPLASPPRLQLTVVVPEHEPWLGVAETKVRPAGRTSVRVTPVAALGPLFMTVRS